MAKIRKTVKALWVCSYLFDIPPFHFPSSHISDSFFLTLNMKPSHLSICTLQRLNCDINHYKSLSFLMIFIVPVNCNVELVLSGTVTSLFPMYTCNCTVVWGPMLYIQEQVEPCNCSNSCVCVIWRFLLHCRLHYSSVYYTVITMKLCESGIFVSHVIPAEFKMYCLA